MHSDLPAVFAIGGNAYVLFGANLYPKPIAYKRQCR